MKPIIRFPATVILMSLLLLTQTACTGKTRGFLPGYPHCDLIKEAAGGDVDKIRELLGKNAYINARDKLARTPLHYAARNGHADAVAFLIEKGADVYARDTASETPLFYAVRGGHKKVLRLLVEKGADINAIDKSDKTPLDIAIEAEDSELISCLRENGAKTGKEIREQGNKETREE